jgi:serine/threonine protein kinase
MLAGSVTSRSGQTTRGTGPQTTKLLDFGLAKWAESEQRTPLAAQPTRLDVTAQGTMVGTLQYMAPEQLEGREADARTDIFALGTLVYEMVTARRAFEGKSQASLSFDHGQRAGACQLRFSCSSRRARSHRVALPRQRRRRPLADGA